MHDRAEVAHLHAWDHGLTVDSASFAKAADAEALAREFETRLVESSTLAVRVAYSVLRHREDTEDVVQDVFVTAHRALPSFRGDSKLSTWLHRIAVTRALNHIEKAEEKLKRVSDPLDPLNADGPKAIGTPLDALESKDLMRRLTDCLQKLPTAWRVVLALRDAEENTYEHIAELLQVELGTVRSRLARARASLKDCVQGRAA